MSVWPIQSLLDYYSGTYSRERTSYPRQRQEDIVHDSNSFPQRITTEWKRGKEEGGMEWIEKRACERDSETIVYLSFFDGSDDDDDDDEARGTSRTVRVLMLPAPKSSLPFIFPSCVLATSRSSGAFINEVVTAEWEYAVVRTEWRGSEKVPS